MTNTTEHINYLLRNHDCVILPGIGALITSYRSATFNTSGGIITPPCKQICFNASISNNDGLLASSIARRDVISFETARDRVEQSCAQMLQQLKTTGIFELQGIGTLSMGTEQNITFSPNSNYTSPSHFGLQSFSMPTLSQIDQDETVSKHSETEPIRDPRYFHFRLRKNYVKVAACACLAISLGFTVFQLPFSHEVDTASLLPTTSKQVIKKVNATPKSNIIKPLKRQPISMQTESRETENTSPEPGMYYLIVASTPNDIEIEQFIKKNGNDKTLKIVKTNTMSRVYAAKSKNKDELLSTLRDSNLQAKYKMPWIWQAK